MILSLRRIVVSFLAAVLLAGVALAVGPSSASAAGTSAVLNPYEADLVARTNAARVDAGLPALVAKPGLTDLARTWAATMGSAGALSHNGNLSSDLLASGAPQWTAAAENVGQGGSSSAVFTAYWNSAPHKANILRDGVTSIGIGATRTSDGKVWDVMVFTNAYDDTYGAGKSTMQPVEASGELTVVTPPPTTTAPVTTTTAPPATTVPPTTTTTLPPTTTVPPTTTTSAPATTTTATVAPTTTTAPPRTTVAPTTTAAAPATTTTVAPTTTSVAPTTTTPAPTPPKLYKTAFGSAIVKVVNGTPVPMSYDDWKATGFAAYDTVGSQVVKYDWSSTLYARSTYPGSFTPVTEAINGGQWAALGYAAPAPVPLVAGSTVRQWQTSNELFLVAPTGEVHKLGYQEWLATGSMTPTLVANQGYIKLTWDGSIGVSPNVAAGQGRPIGFGEWSAAQFPTPLQQNRFPGDQFTQQCGSSAIVYAGPTLYSQVSFQQWQAAGSPTPVRTGRC